MPRKAEKDKIFDALCLQYCTNLLFMDSSSDSSDESADDAFEMFHSFILATIVNRRGHLRVPKTLEWRVNVLDHLDDVRFSQMLRVNPAEFNHILDLIKNDPVFKSSASSLQLPIKLQLQITLYRLGCSGEGATIRKVASVFGVGDGGTLQIVTRRVVKAINNLKQRFLFWPNVNERRRILSRSKYELPGCIGYVDGTEIKFAEAPARNHALFFSRKRQYSIKMQVICDDNMKIRQASYGHAGSIHDAKICTSSGIARSPTRFLNPFEKIVMNTPLNIEINSTHTFLNTE